MVVKMMKALLSEVTGRLDNNCLTRVRVHILLVMSVSAMR